MEVEAALGVPLSTPVEAFSETPDGSDGEIDQELTALPEFVGLIVGIADPDTTEIEFGEYVIFGTTTVHVTVVVAVRPLEESVTVSTPDELDV